MKLINLRKDDPKLLEVSYLLFDYFKELHSPMLIGTANTALKMLTTMLNINNYIYYLTDDDDNVVSFVTISINSQYDMTTPHMVVDYFYIKPSHRGTKVTALMFGLIGHVADELGMDVLGTTFVTSSNINNAAVVEGEHLASTFLYKREVFKKRYKKYIRRYL